MGRPSYGSHACWYTSPARPILPRAQTGRAGAMETPRAVPGSAAHRWAGLHCSFTMERPARGVVVLRISGHDVGEFGDAPLRALEGYLWSRGMDRKSTRRNSSH